MGVTKQQLFNTVQRIKAYVDSVAMNGGNLNLDNVLTKDNIVEYTPTEDYHPATKQYVDNHSIKVSAEPNNSIEQKEDGLYVPTIADAKISTKENNAITQEEDGLYVPSVAETNISTEENNAVVKKDDGIFVEDKTDTIQAINDKIENINRYQKYVNTELDYCYLNLENLTEKLTLSVGTVIPFTPANCKNMEFDSENHTVTLKAGKTYKISADIRIQNGDVIFYIKDIITSKGLKNFVKSTTKNQGITDVNLIYTPQNDCKIQICCAYIYDGNIPYLPEGDATQNYGYFIVEEISRQIVVDPVEHINNESGIEDTPVGHIISHMGTEAPAHYLICDGAEYNISDYPYLTKHFVDEFGSVNYFGGDGITTFAVPDLRGEFLRGSGTATRNSGNGANVGVHQNGTTIPFYGVGAETLNLYRDGNLQDTTLPTEMDKQINTDKLIANNIKYSNNFTSSVKYHSYTTRPTNTSVLYCIKYEPTYCISVKQTTEVSDKAFLSQVSEEYGIADSPVGHIMSHMGKTAPAHYLICDGTEYNITDYPHLTKHFTNEFGSVNYFGGDGITTFAVPDLRGEFLRGTGTATRNSGTGAEVGKHQEPTGFPSSHLYPSGLRMFHRYDDADLDSAGGFGHKYADKTVQPKGKVKGVDFYDGKDFESSVAGALFTSRPTNTSVLYCIKYEPTYCINVNGYIQKETILWDGSLMADCSYDVEKETVDYTINLSDDIFNYEEIIIKYCGYITFNDTRTSPLITSIRPNDLYNFGSSNSTDFMLPVDMFYATFCLWGYFSNEKTIKMHLKNVQNTSKSAMDTLEVYRVIGIKTSYKNNENTGNNSSENLELTDEEIEELVDKAYNEAIAEIEEVSP